MREKKSHEAELVKLGNNQLCIVCLHGSLAFIYQIGNKKRHQALVEGIENGDPESVKVVLLSKKTTTTQLHRQEEV